MLPGDCHGPKGPRNDTVISTRLVLPQQPFLNTSGDMTAEKMFEAEKEYAKQNWSTWAAYVG